ncbi:uncharacterized protein [Apostichopus japonicus]|uniref:uncharacterized protein n=1 Tax=Stichopus japonicus TaxID=307972 RepID=UPI003AB56D6C
MGGKTSKPRPSSQDETNTSSSLPGDSSSVTDEHDTRTNSVKRKYSQESISSNDDESEDSPITSGRECAEEIPFTVEKFEARPRKYLMTSQSAPLLKDTSNWVKRQHDHTRTTDNIPPLTPESKNMRILYEQESPFMMTIQNSRSSNMRETDRVRLPEHEWQDACTESLRKALFIQPQQPDGRILGTRSAPTSVDRIETVRATSPHLKREMPRTDRRHSILSSLNCHLDVIPERVEDEKENPDDYEYSEMDIYF